MLQSCFFFQQRLQKEEIDPLQKEVEQVNKSGQSLVQSAAVGVATGTLEEELETLNDNWAHLCEKVFCDITSNITSNSISMNVYRR